MSELVVVDTDVASFLLKHDTRISRYMPHMDGKTWVISFMTEAELEQWMLLANWQAKRKEWFRMVLAKFVIVPSSRDLVVTWAEVMVGARRAGRRIETADAWIAATAILHDATLLTHNGDDYRGVPGLKLFSSPYH